LIKKKKKLISNEHLPLPISIQVPPFTPILFSAKGSFKFFISKNAIFKNSAKRLIKIDITLMLLQLTNDFLFVSAIYNATPFTLLHSDANCMWSASLRATVRHVSVVIFDFGVLSIIMAMVGGW
jgi:hypothetical protein